jgi:catechol 2,3-dioxygenase-like lactoylglutathione lyase family enzyme
MRGGLFHEKEAHMANPLETSKVAQIGIIVRDIEAAAKDYADFLGLPMPAISETAPFEQSRAVYMGRPCQATAKLAFLPVGDGIDIELIQPDGKPSTWQEHLDTHGEGIHHIAFWIKDTAGKTKRLEMGGMGLLQKGEWGSGRYAYFDARQKLKTVIETLESDEK